MTAYVGGDTATATILAIAATQAACPSDGDTTADPWDATPERPSDRESTIRGLAAEDRAERQWALKEEWEERRG